MIHPEDFSAASLRFFGRQSFGRGSFSLACRYALGMQMGDSRSQLPVAGYPISYNIWKCFRIFHRMLQYLTGDICTCNADGRFQKPVAGCPISCTEVEWLVIAQLLQFVPRCLMQWIASGSFLNIKKKTGFCSIAQLPRCCNCCPNALQCLWTGFPDHFQQQLGWVGSDIWYKRFFRDSKPS